MINIGQELKDARSRLGFSIKEAAEATKVRAEYLAKLEDNSFDIPLDTVYVRGFLRLYSKYLKLDPDRITDAYNRMQMKDRREEDGDPDREALGTFSLNSAVEEPEGKGSAATVDGFGSLDGEDGRSPWMVPMVAGGALAILFVGILLVRLFFFGTEGSVTDAGNMADNSVANDTGARVQDLPDNIITITAIAPVFVHVSRTDDGSILFSGNLAAGAVRSFERTAELSIRCEQVENLMIEKGGMPVKDLVGVTGKRNILL